MTPVFTVDLVLVGKIPLLYICGFGKCTLHLWDGGDMLVDSGDLDYKINSLLFFFHFHRHRRSEDCSVPVHRQEPQECWNNLEQYC